MATCEGNACHCFDALRDAQYRPGRNNSLDGSAVLKLDHEPDVLTSIVLESRAQVSRALAEHQREHRHCEHFSAGHTGLMLPVGK